MLQNAGMFSPDAVIGLTSELCRAMHDCTLVLCMSNRQRQWCLDLWAQWLNDQANIAGKSELAAPLPQVYTLHDWLWRETQFCDEDMPRRADEASQQLAWRFTREQALAEKSLEMPGLLNDLGAVARRFARACEEWRIPLAKPFPNHDGADFFRRWYHKTNELLAYKNLANDNNLIERFGDNPPIPSGREMILVGQVFINPLLERLFNAWQKKGVTLTFWTPPKADKQQYHLIPGGKANDALSYAVRQAYELHGKNKRVLVVVPHLLSEWHRVFENFRQTFTPNQGTHDCMLDGERPFNLSGGLLLADLPPISSAISLLGLDGRSQVMTLAELLHNPTIDPDMPRALLLARLWRYAGHLTLGELAKLAVTSQLQDWDWPRKLLRMLDEQPDIAWPSEWARLFDEQLRDCGWMRRVSQDSYDYQVIQAFTGLLEELARLDSYSEPIGRRSALSILLNLAGNRLFQPSPDDSRLNQAPVQVLSPFEAVGLVFDHTIICGLDGDSLAAMQRLHLPLPRTISDQFNLPGSNAERILQDSHLFWNALAATAPALTLCHVNTETPGGEDPLPRNHFCESEPREVQPLQHEQFPADYHISSVEQATPLPDPRVTSSSVKAQSLCGWQGWWAFAGLDTQEMQPEHYPSPAWRGLVLHEAMAELLGKQAARVLACASDEQGDDRALGELVRQAVKHAMQSHAQDAPMLGRAARDSCVRIFSDALFTWMKKRETGATPLACEREMTDIAIGKLRARRIRLDRVDRVGKGVAVIDYKTGALPSLKLDNENEAKADAARVEDPQLLLYAIALRQQGEPVTAIAYARLLPRYQSGWRVWGTPEAAEYFPVKPKKLNGEWQLLLDCAIANLEERVNRYVQGQAALDPLEADKLACRYCALHASCRIVAQKSAVRPHPPTKDSPESINSWAASHQQYG